MLQIVSGPLENFQTSSARRQKHSFDTLMTAARERSDRGSGLSGRAPSLCSERAASFSRLPVERIEQLIRPSAEHSAMPSRR